MCYMRNRENSDFAKTVGKYYRQAEYQKKAFGKYNLSEVSNGVIPPDVDEDKVIQDFLNGVENLKEYPSSKAKLYYKLIQAKCIKSDATIEMLSEDCMLSPSMTYRRLQEAFSIIGEYMAQKGSTGGLNHAEN